MRYKPDQKENTRAQILKAAGRSLRQQGIRGTGVSAVMKGAGLTQGGFYDYFSSKDALIEEAFIG